MRRVLTVMDEGYTMWTIVVDEDKVEDISNVIRNSHDEFYNDEGLQDKYGSYYEYVNETLDKIDGIEILGGDILEL